MSQTASSEPQLASILFGPDRDGELARLLEGPSVTRAVFPDGSPIWLVTRHDDIVTVLTDRRFSNDPSKQSSYDLAATVGLPEDIAPYFMQTLGTYDPPDHTRLRNLVSREFTARRTERMRPRIQEMTDALLDALARRDEVDIVEEFAMRLPVQVICELLGVPDADRERWQTWAKVLVDQDMQKFGEAARGLVEYLTELIEDKRTAPGEDLLSALVHAHDGGTSLSTEELTSVSVSLLIGGHDTTVNLIGNGTMLLLTHPDQLEQLRADLDQTPRAVEEFLRYAGPADIGFMRFALEPVELGGVTIEAGDSVQVLFGAANRDPQRYDAPECLDLRRETKEHLGFGHGIHFCLGAALARVEGDIAFRSLITRFPEMSLAVPADQVGWIPHFTRKVGKLPVRLGKP